MSTALSDLSALLSNMTCVDLLSTLTEHDTLAAASQELRRTILATGGLSLAMIVAIPLIFIIQYRRGLFWLFRLRREARGTCIVNHPLNVYLLLELLAAIFIFILAIFTKTVVHDGERKLDQVVQFTLATWIANNLALFYITLGTIVALPERSSCKVSRFIKHPHVASTLVVLFPVFVLSACIPNLLLAQRYSSMVGAAYNTTIDRMATMALQDPASLVPLDAQPSLLQGIHSIMLMQRAFITFFIIVSAYAALLTPFSCFAFYKMVVTLRVQTLEQMKRVESLGPADCPEADEKGLPRALSIQVPNTADVQVDRARDSPVLGYFSESPTPLLPTSSAMSQINLPPSPAEQKDTNVLQDTVSVLPRSPDPAVVAPSKATMPTLTKLQHVRQSVMTQRSSSQSTYSQQQDSQAAVQRLAYLKRCFRTMTAFYIAVGMSAIMNLGLALYLACAFVLSPTDVPHTLIRVFIFYDSIGVSITAMCFVLFAFKLFDTVMTGDSARKRASFKIPAMEQVAA